MNRLENHPEWIGNLDGVPAHYRDQANRARIPSERARLQAERDKVAAQLQEMKNRHNRADVYKIAEVRRQLDEFEAKLNALNEIEKSLDRGDRHLLALDVSGERAKAAIGNGNLDTADHVAVFTPGVDSTVDGNMAGYDNDMRELREKAQHDLERAGRGNESVAVVTWLNYEPPKMNQGEGLAALQDGKAYEGAARLAPFLEGINASRPDDPHLTSLGHSYGSLTTGIALRDHATGVDEMAVFGSPGLEVDNASQLHVPQGHVYNLRAEGDWLWLTTADQSSTVQTWTTCPASDSSPPIPTPLRTAATSKPPTDTANTTGPGTRTPPANGTWPTSSPARAPSIDQLEGEMGDKPIRPCGARNLRAVVARGCSRTARGGMHVPRPIAQQHHEPKP